MRIVGYIFTGQAGRNGKCKYDGSLLDLFPTRAELFRNSFLGLDLSSAKASPEASLTTNIDAHDMPSAMATQQLAAA